MSIVLHLLFTFHRFKCAHSMECVPVCVGGCTYRNIQAKFRGWCEISNTAYCVGNHTLP